MNKPARLIAAGGLVASDLAVLATLRPDLGVLARGVAAPHAWIAASGADGAALDLAGAAIWSLALWLGVGLLAAIAAGLPGGCGRSARWLAQVLLPATLHRAVAGAAGLGVLLVPVAAGAAGPAVPAGRGGSAAASLSSAPVPSPAWPSDPPALPAPGWPTASPPTAPRTVPPPGSHAAQPARPAPANGAVVVRPGDCLWEIAAAQLGHGGTPARTAAAWPRWYAANRAVIGADPNLIRPGQRLAPPASSSAPR
ncbi:MAG: hypothetical protein M3Y44_17510 [Actinomycetota bacterium]|nr:hypothetical protein [Actinomycetota bacterium]